MFENLIVQQENIIKMLEGSAKLNRLSHAYLFYGPKGVKKAAVANYFAAMLYCKEEHPCGKCSNCLAIINQRHLNVLNIKADGQSIKKEQITALLEEFSKTSFIEGPRIYIIYEAEKMTPSAANSLLKFLEDPLNNQTYAILITEKVDLILPTIRSRTINIPFFPIKNSILINQLIEEGLDIELAHILPNLTNNLEDAIELSDNPFFTGAYRLITEYLNIVSEKGSLALYYRSNQNEFYSKENLVIFLNLLKLLYRDLYYFSILREIYIYKNKEDLFINITKFWDSEKIKNNLNYLLDFETKLIYNINIGLQVLELFIKQGGEI